MNFVYFGSKLKSALSLYGCGVLIWTFVALEENYGDYGYQRFIEAETG